MCIFPKAIVIDVFVIILIFVSLNNLGKEHFRHPLKCSFPKLLRETNIRIITKTSMTIALGNIHIGS